MSSSDNPASTEWSVSLAYQDIIPDTIAMLPLLRLPATSPRKPGPGIRQVQTPRRIQTVPSCRLYKNVAECKRAAQSKGLCKLHGGGRPCLVEGCEKKAHMRQLCRQHGGGAKCATDNCDKWAQRNGLCLMHAKRVDDDALAVEAMASFVV
ncbi:hypothetical protein H310_07547 [Aphanomyces invadans]|uniref:Uncharacterized protein n=1 Tax=Aphanomyces invadans TaxID=157072 RepID=A0A024U1K6_9STRA|nr:hypothetical protein H310_07547 [Aphanomyces invadans]ETW00139.1 hypothetical protein H310_07547 [Aphanomyces invadans]|eukprot:XP_008871164.1 hypothetical protein H310_07547 [Aphanomyces invadans]